MLNIYQQRIQERLDTYLQDDQVPSSLLAAMRYAVFNGGKRIRPSLIYMTSTALGASLEAADKTACAIEMIHCYSLIHDDLPCMDDDDLRRGQPTVHIQFDEATAILAGDALQAYAFELIAGDTALSPNTRLDVIRILAKAAGPAGMVGGQALDLAAEAKQISHLELETMHRRKTGDLISACLAAGARIGGADPATEQALIDYGYALGLAFQVRDDILDHTGDTQVLGKPSGSDQGNAKSTFISTHGLTAASAQLDALHRTAIEALKPLGKTGTPLIALADFIARRDH
ncbi:MAG: polyprenyl synthetase family protein [SAR86 cluster bacterium]|uniref:Polyprenyl synthetase family protein n=1 Tax=SAR86 cluster bacterium TaxID=2030880 RepID=A0A972VZB1_9GAMM|nr:polyprenyl synthetase family protein [SAR86 cluster bacterium]